MSDTKFKPCGWCGSKHIVEQKEKFLKFRKEGNNISKACELSGIKRNSYYAWLRYDLVFKVASEVV